MFAAWCLRVVQLRCNGKYLLMLPIKSAWKNLMFLLFLDFQLPFDILCARTEANGSDMLFVVILGTTTDSKLLISYLSLWDYTVMEPGKAAVRTLADAICQCRRNP